MPRRRWPPSGSRGTARGGRTSSPAGSGSGSRWPGRSSTGRRCSCSTSRSARSDLKLRREMQLELKQIQRDVGITFVFVTHDQEEALSMSDRVAVFNEGKVEQVATPVELYESPASPFVAGFVGTSNRIGGEAARAGPRHRRRVRRTSGEAAGRRHPVSRSTPTRWPLPAACARSSTSDPAPTPSSSSTPGRGSPCRGPTAGRPSGRRSRSRTVPSRWSSTAPRCISLSGSHQVTQEKS